MSESSSLLRERTPYRHARVTYIELFFDLVFVFAVTQLSHTLLHDLTPLALAQVGVLMIAMWWQWIDTSWVTNWLDPERMAVRLMLMALMLAGLVFSAVLPHAFSDAGLVIAIAYVVMHLGRDGFALWVMWSEPQMRRNFLRIASWHVFIAAFWLAGGLADPHTRLALWAVALGFETIAPSLYFWTPWLGRSHIEDWDVEGAHMAERCALFIIIALGESILVTGATFSALAWTREVIAGFLVAFVSSLAMWWIYFNAAADRASAMIAHARDPGRLARLAYTYIHALVVAGIIVAAVGDELVLAHPGGETAAPVMAAILGGPALYLAGIIAFKRAVFEAWPLIKIVGLAALAILAVCYQNMSPLLLAGGAAVVLIAVAALETYQLSAVALGAVEEPH